MRPVPHLSSLLLLLLLLLRYNSLDRVDTHAEYGGRTTSSFPPTPLHPAPDSTLPHLGRLLLRLFSRFTPTLPHLGGGLLFVLFIRFTSPFQARHAAFVWFSRRRPRYHPEPLEVIGHAPCVQGWPAVQRNGRNRSSAREGRQGFPPSQGFDAVDRARGRLESHSPLRPFFSLERVTPRIVVGKTEFSYIPCQSRQGKPGTFSSAIPV